jgi:hypothetical protein
MMSESDARKNFEFFLEQKTGRIEALAQFLKFFGVSLSFSQQAKSALDAWLATYAAFLYVSERGSSFLTHNPGWVGPRAGFNVIFDLASFLGDFAIHENPNLSWEMDNQREDGRTRTDHCFQRPAIFATRALPSFPRDLISDVHSFCHSQCEGTYMLRRPRFTYGSPALSRQFATKTLRYIQLCANDDFETASREWRDDALRR